MGTYGVPLIPSEVLSLMKIFDFFRPLYLLGPSLFNKSCRFFQNLQLLFSV
jgi:hypothetical protein